MSGISDQALVEAVRKNHGPSIDMIVQKFGSLLGMLCSKLGVRGEEDKDAKQVAWARIFKDLDKWSPKDRTLSAWIYMTANAAIIDWIRQQRGRSGQKTDANTVSIDKDITDGEGNSLPLHETMEDTSAPAPDQSVKVRKILDAIKLLPAQQRQAMELRVEDRSMAEIGKLMGLSEARISLLLSDARTSLAHRLGISTRDLPYTLKLPDLSDLSLPPSFEEALTHLTSRQHQVVLLMLKGLRPRDIVAQTGIKIGNLSYLRSSSKYRLSKYSGLSPDEVEAIFRERRVVGKDRTVSVTPKVSEPGPPKFAKTVVVDVPPEQMLGIPTENKEPAPPIVNSNPCKLFNDLLEVLMVNDGSFDQEAILTLMRGIWRRGNVRLGN